MQKKPSIRFREFLLTKTKISRIVELSSVRRLVFKNAIAPAVVLAYSFSDEEPLENRFEYISMKPNIFFRLFNIVVVERPDIKYVRQKFLLEKDWAWKTLVYGLSGDIDIITRLKANYCTLGESINIQSPRIIEGRGIEYNDGAKSARLDASHLLKRPLLKSRGAIRPFLLFENFEIFEKERIHRVSDEALFHAPYCLVTKGTDTIDYTMRAVYSETDFVFRDTVWAIKGSLEQKSTLLNITGLLNSKAYAYLNLMLGSSTGIEREQRLQDEILAFPLVLSDEIAMQVELIQNLSKQEDFSIVRDASGEIKKLNRMIFEAFNLANNVFVNYALNVQIPQLTGTKHGEAFRAVDNQDLSDYAKPFLEALSAVFGVSGKFVSANIYPTVAKHYSAVEVVVHDRKPRNGSQIMENPASLQTALTRFSAHKINDMFFDLKDIIHFEEDSFYIIKPHYYKNWHPAIAQLDLAEVVDQILSRDGE
jgi:hypothetical protein